MKIYISPNFGVESSKIVLIFRFFIFIFIFAMIREITRFQKVSSSSSFLYQLVKKSVQNQSFFFYFLIFMKILLKPNFKREVSKGVLIFPNFIIYIYSFSAQLMKNWSKSSQFFFLRFS